MARYRKQIVKKFPTMSYDDLRERLIEFGANTWKQQIVKYRAPNMTWLQASHTAMLHKFRGVHKEADHEIARAEQTIMNKETGDTLEDHETRLDELTQQQKELTKQQNDRDMKVDALETNVKKLVEGMAERDAVLGVVMDKKLEEGMAQRDAVLSEVIDVQMGKKVDALETNVKKLVKGLAERDAVRDVVIDELEQKMNEKQRKAATKKAAKKATEAEREFKKLTRQKEKATKKLNDLNANILRLQEAERDELLRLETERLKDPVLG